MGRGPTDDGKPGSSAGAVHVGLIGKGIGKSRTPAMHEAEAAAQGFELRYELIDPETMPKPAPDLAEMLAKAEADGFAGVNITHPYKRDVIELLDTLSDSARKVGAVNTVVFANGKRHGHNTDFWGFAESVRRGLTDVDMGTVLLLGAGGGGSAVAHALKAVGVEHLLIYDADAGAAAALAAAANGAVVTDLEQATFAAEGIVNTTPMGMDAHPGTALDMALVDQRHWVADIVYFPLETEFLRQARALGCRTLDGSGMAVFQAVRAFALFTGHTADPARIRATFDAFDPGGR